MAQWILGCCRPHRILKGSDSYKLGQPIAQRCDVTGLQLRPVMPVAPKLRHINSQERMILAMNLKKLLLQHKILISNIKNGGGLLMIWSYSTATRPGHLAVIGLTMDVSLNQSILSNLWFFVQKAKFVGKCCNNFKTKNIQNPSIVYLFDYFSVQIHGGYCLKVNRWVMWHILNK